jgi:hypothetical protein
MMSAPSPMPRSVICSASRIEKIAPAASVTTLVALNRALGKSTISGIHRKFGGNAVGLQCGQYDREDAGELIYPGPPRRTFGGQVAKTRHDLAEQLDDDERRCTAGCRA